MNSIAGKLYQPYQSFVFDIDTNVYYNTYNLQLGWFVTVEQLHAT